MDSVGVYQLSIMKKTPLLATFGLWMILSVSHADTLVLKDGTSMEGSILSSTEEFYVIEIIISNSIKDERKIAKTEVAKLIMTSPDLKAFEILAKLIPTPDQLPPTEYTPKITAVEQFLQAYPSSLQVKNAQKILETLKSELAQISAGSVKRNGAVLTPAEYQANAYDIDARVQETAIQFQLNYGEVLTALRLFANFDREYHFTQSANALTFVMKQVTQNYVDEATRLQVSLPARIKARALSLEQMDLADRKITERAIAEEAVAMDARFKAEKNAKQSWVTLSPFHQASIEETLRSGKLELARLAKVKTILGLDGGRSYAEAWIVIHNGGSIQAVNSAYAAAKAAAVSPRYLAMLQVAAKNR